jgi:hypothetical protein
MRQILKAIVNPVVGSARGFDSSMKSSKRKKKHQRRKSTSLDSRSSRSCEFFHPNNYTATPNPTTNLNDRFFVGLGKGRQQNLSDAFITAQEQQEQRYYALDNHNYTTQQQRQQQQQQQLYSHQL